jgi:hypothetical protein
MFTLRWWHVCTTDMSGPGPAFSWIVLVAILGFGLVALGLLTAGQFVRSGPELLDSGDAEARALAASQRAPAALDSAALPVAEQGGRAGAATAIGVFQLRRMRSSPGCATATLPARAVSSWPSSSWESSLSTLPAD